MLIHQSISKMQIDVLRSFNFVSQDVVDCYLSRRFLGKRRLLKESKRKLHVICMSGRDDPQTRRFRLDTGPENGRNQAWTEFVANGVIAKDSVAPDENLQGQQQLSSSGAELFSAGRTFGVLSFTDHHVLLFGLFACLVTGVLSCVLVAAIPALIALKGAAESVRRLADTAREELPGTMAAVRLSGMEISDLTMELSDLGQEISAGVRSSSRAVHAAEVGLQRMGSFTSIAVVQKRASRQAEVMKPAVVSTERNDRALLIQSRSLVCSFVFLTRFSSWLGHFWRFVRPWHQMESTSKL